MSPDLARLTLRVVVAFFAPATPGRGAGAPPADSARIWADGDRLILDWGALADRHEYRFSPAEGPPLVGRMGKAAGWKPLRPPPQSDSFELRITPPIPLALGAPATHSGADGRVEARRSTSWILWLVLTQLLLVAIPEEFFYRAYLQRGLESFWPGGRRRVLGVMTNPSAVAATSALFALGHFVVGFDPQRLAVFFPSLLFGWMKDATGSIAAAAVFHALCNIVVDLLSKAYLYG